MRFIFHEDYHKTMNINGLYKPIQHSFRNEIICGDSISLLKTVPSDSIDLIITSPPYFKQREYDNGGIGNESTPEDYISSLLPIFQECVRIIKPTGNIVWNLGDKYEESSLLLMPYRFAIAATAQCAVKLVNSITWVKSNPTPRQFQRRLVSSTEPFLHFVKGNEYKYFIDRFLETEKIKTEKIGGGENIGKSYFALIERSELTSAQKELAKTALTQVIKEVHNGEIESFRMKIRGIHSEPFGGQAGGRKIQLDRNGFTIIRLYGNPLKKDVINTPVESLKNCPHPAIYPVHIVEQFLHLLTEKGDIVLDPFIGSGSTAVAAAHLERIYIGFDISQEYCDYAQQRISKASQQLILLETNDHYTTPNSQ